MQERCHESVRPSVLVSTSAVGFYGERGDQVLTEASAAGQGFLADLCKAWEREATRAAEFGLTRSAMLWSNKALLPILWRLFPRHPNLLESYLDGPRAMTSYVRKPIYSREGANITVRTEPYGSAPLAVVQTFGHFASRSCRKRVMTCS
jgi:Glutathionylspermidine synthase preATP-grasp